VTIDYYYTLLPSQERYVQLSICCATPWPRIASRVCYLSIEGRTALQAAAEKGNIEMVQLLLDACADVNAPPAYRAWVTALQVSAIKGYLGIAIILLDNGADVNAQASSESGRTALAGAAEHGRIDMVKLLLNASVELDGSENAQYREALQLASEYGHNAVRKLIKAHYERGGNE
jgi:ankyrin repeat protein